MKRYIYPLIYLISCITGAFAQVSPPQAPPVQMFCPGPESVVGKLQATVDQRNAALWYSSASGGAPLQSNTPLNAGTYYVAQRDAASFSSVSSLGSGFYEPEGIAADNSGNLYIADSRNYQIKKMTPDGSVSVVAGTGRTYTGPGANPIGYYTDGLIAEAEFELPSAITVDNSGNIYVTDGGNLRKIGTDGMVVTLARSVGNEMEDGPLATAKFGPINLIAMDVTGNIYFVNGVSIRKISSSGMVSTVAGGEQGYLDANGRNAKFSSISGIAVDHAGNIYVTEGWEGRVRKITPSGDVTTVVRGDDNTSVNGLLSNAGFSEAQKIAVDPSGNIYVVDEEIIRKIGTDGIVISLAGGGNTGIGAGKDASFFPGISGMTTDNNGVIYATGTFGVRKIIPNSPQESARTAVEVSMNCPCPVNLNYTSQAALNGFLTQYSHCTTISGNINLSEGISDLSPLQNLQSIGGYLAIENTALENLNGLSALHTIGGTLAISNNAQLRELTGLSGLTEIKGALNIYDNAKLQSLAGLSSLEKVGEDWAGMSIEDNPQLMSLAGLAALKSVGGELAIVDSEFQDLSGLSGLHTVGGLYLGYNKKLQQASGMTALQTVTRWIYINNNDVLQNLDGLSGITSMGGEMELIRNKQLISIDGLGNINPAGITELTIQENTVLSLCNVPNICTFMGTDKPRTISGNAGACGDAISLSAACSVAVACPTGDVSFENQEQIVQFGINYKHCTVMPGNVIIGPSSGTANITNLDGLNHLTEIGGGLSIRSTSLEYLSGLNGLLKVKESIWINGNDKLKEVSGLNGIEEISAELYIGSNPVLSSVTGLSHLKKTGGLQLYLNSQKFGTVVNGLSNISGLSSLTEVNGYLKIENNYALESIAALGGIQTLKGNILITANSKLASLEGLEGITGINNQLEISNNAVLTSIAGIKNINHETMRNLVIRDNPALSICNLPNLCEYLGTLRSRTIRNNLQNCLDEQAVTASCASLPAPCPKGDVFFLSQQSIDDFAVTYGHCNSIGGNVYIEGADIEDLSKLAGIELIGGNLRIEKNPKLSNLHGLEALQSIGGGSSSFTAMLSLYDNKILEDLDGLSGLKNLNGSDVLIGSNPELTNLDGLKNVTASQAGLVSVGSNTKLQQVDGLKGINKATRIWISNNPVLTHVNGLSGIIDFTTLSRSGEVFISGNALLNSLQGLKGLPYEKISKLELSNNGALSVCNLPNICAYLAGSGERTISGNLGNCADADAVVAACSAAPADCPTGNVSFITQDKIDEFGITYAHCTVLPGNVTINSTNVENLNGLGHVESIGGNLIIDETYLENLSGLGKLRSVGGFFRLFKNYYLEDLTGVGSLETIGEYFNIQTNGNLVTTKGMSSLNTIGGTFMLINNEDLEKIEGFSSLSEIGGNLSIETHSRLSQLQGLSALKKLGGNLDFRSNGLLNLNGLEGLQDFNGEINLYSNKALESIEGLKNIPADKIKRLTIQNNQGANGAFGLSVCNLPNICAYLATARPRTISGNLGECATTAAVIAACSVSQVECPTGDIVLNTQQLVDHFGVNYGHCTVIDGSLLVSGPVTNLKGLANVKVVKGSFLISNSELENLDDLAALKSVEAYLFISGNPKLKNMNGFSGLESVGSTFRIDENTSLENLSGLSGLKTIGGEFRIVKNTKLQNLAGLSSLQTLGSNLYVGENPALKNLNGLSALQSVGSYPFGYVWINKNPQLEHASIPLLKTVGANLSITDQDNLQSISFPVLTSAEFVSFKNNGKVQSLNGIPGLETLHFIEISGNAQLRDLDGLSGLKSTKSVYILNNPLLASIQGVKNIKESDLEELIIKNNGALSLCNLSNICSYLSSDPVTHSRDISGNLGSCASEALVKASCGTAEATLSLGEAKSPTTCGGKDGRIAFTTSLEAGVYTLSFKSEGKDNTAQVTVTGGAFSLMNLTKGIYSNFSITHDQKTVIAVGERTLSDPSSHTFAISAKTDPTGCNGENGSIAFTTNLLGGSYTLSYAKGGKDATAEITVSGGGFTLSGLSAASYNAFRISTGGCTFTLSGPVTLAASSAMLSVKQKTDPTTCKGADGTLSLTVSIADGSYSLRYTEDGAGKTATVAVSGGGFTLSDLRAGQYAGFTLTGNGCEYVLNTPVVLAAPVRAGGPILTDGPTEFCAGSGVNLTAPEGISYEWSTGAKTRGIRAVEGGVYKVKVTSSQGCISESQITLIRKDCNVPPMAVCKPVVVLVAKDDCYAILRTEDLDLGSYDNNNDWFNRSIDINSLLRVGSYIATMTVVDIHGASTSCTSQVHVVDHSAPVVRARGLTLELNEQGKASISVADVDAGSYDNCGGLTLSLNRTEFDCADLGHLQVILTGTDGSGNVSQALADIQVVDNRPPVVVGRNITLEIDDSGEASLNAEDLAGSVSDNCGIWSITASKTVFSCTNLGENRVTLRVEDVQGTVTEAEVIVTVVDKTAPQVTAENTTLYLDESGKATLSAGQLGASATDNCGVDSLEVSRTAFDCTDLGEHEVAVWVTDRSGNRNEVRVWVTVADTTSPTILAEDITLYLDAQGQARLTVDAVDKGSWDNCGIALRELQYTAFDCSDLGEHEVVYRVTDSSGNVSIRSIHVTVKDETVPLARAKDEIVELDGTGRAIIKVSDLDDGSTDNCTIVSMTLSQENFTCEDLGLRLLTLTVIDGSGHKSTARAEVLIRDPEGVCPCSYGVLAEDKVVLRSNEVNAGGVGASSANGIVKLRETIVQAEGTFVRSQHTRFDTESESSVYLRGQAPQPEAFRTNDTKVKKREKVKKAQTKTFAAGSYGKLRAGKNAKLVFSGGEIKLRDMKLKKGVEVSFTAGTVVLVRDKSKMGREVVFNRDREQVRLYGGGDVVIGSGSEVTGYLHSRSTLKTIGGGEKYLEGFFAASTIRGSRNTRWTGGGLLCRDNEQQALLAAASDGEEKQLAEALESAEAITEAVGEGLAVRAWPNTFTTQIAIAITGDTAGGEVQLIDRIGNVVRSEQYKGKEAVLNLTTGSVQAGLYILRVSSGGQTRTLRVVK